MKLFSQKLSSGKWGIYSDTGLLATVDSQVICETIMANLATGRRDAPFDDVNALYQVPELRKKTTQFAGDSSENTVQQGTQSALVAATNGQNLDRKGVDARALKTSQVSTQDSVTQELLKQVKTANKQTSPEPLTGRAKARANGSVKRKRRSTSRTDPSLAS